MGFDKSLFLAEPDDNLICNLCLGVFDKPTTACTNGHTYCLECQSTSQRYSNQCPDCRQDMLSPGLLSRPLQNMISGLKLKCQHSQPSQEDGHEHAPLTKGAIRRLAEFRKCTFHTGFNPILQIIDIVDTDQRHIQRLKSNMISSSGKYFAVVSDGEHSLKVSLKESAWIVTDQITDKTIIKVDYFGKSEGGVNGEIELRGIYVIDTNIGAKIGHPVDIRDVLDGTVEPPASRRRIIKDDAREEGKSNLCQWQGQVSKYAEHLEQCTYTLMDCPHKEFGCKVRLPRSGIDQHVETDCHHRRIKCKQCWDHVLPGKMEVHVKECKMRRAVCQYCNMVMRHWQIGTKQEPPYYDNLCSDQSDDDDATVNDEDSSLTGHYKICPNIQLRCEFYNLGCEQEICRKDLADHYRKRARYHARLVNDSISSDEKKIDWEISSNRFKGQDEDGPAYFIESPPVQVHGAAFFLRLHVQGQICELELLVGPRKTNLNIYDLQATTDAWRPFSSSADDAGDRANLLDAKILRWEDETIDRNIPPGEEIVSVPEGRGSFEIDTDGMENYMRVNKNMLLERPLTFQENAAGVTRDVNVDYVNIDVSFKVMKPKRIYLKS